MTYLPRFKFATRTLIKTTSVHESLILTFREDLYSRNFAYAKFCENKTLAKISEFYNIRSGKQTIGSVKNVLLCKPVNMYMYINNPLMPDFSLANVHLFSGDLNQIVRIGRGDVLMNFSSVLSLFRASISVTEETKHDWCA